MPSTPVPRTRRTRRAIATTTLTLSVTCVLAACGSGGGSKLPPDPKVGNASAAAPVADTKRPSHRRSRPA
ncbi:hypothetical protein [Streptomyces sp. NPDC051109]|uniref:hypothetical protein n=1 Tax=Streptomyces sp. NPDC051109 TaxID=3365642 RepID=UPI0037A37134